MVQHIVRAFVQLFYPSFIWMVIRAFFITLLLFGGAMAGFLYGIDPYLPNWGDFLAGFIYVVVAIILFLPVSAIVVSMFVEEAAMRVEKGYYPNRLGERDQPTFEAIGVGLRFALKLLVVNLLLLPVYLFLPGVNIVVFFLANGYFAGREYFEMVALRHYAAPDVRSLRRKARFKVWFAGLVIAAGLVIPIFNFFAPLFGAAFMVHVFQDVDARARS